jgi:protein O-mannosyl-transferase
MNSKLVGTAILIVVAITLVYSSVIHASFVLDDVIDFVDMKWLSHDDWQHYIFKDFNYWTNYFRPLVLLFFTLQVRLFNDAPGPMHAVSLSLHLANTLLVGLLSLRCSTAISGGASRKIALFAVSMLVYGLHPVLVEPVTWIGCQFDLIATLFILLGMLANSNIQRRAVRVATVSGLFFLAACSKESAVTFPLMLAVFDWALIFMRREDSGRSILRDFLHRNGLTYVGMLLAGIAYLLFRHWALGHAVPAVESDTLPWFAHFQEVCYIYLRYWVMLFWPAYGMNPIHEHATQSFLQISAGSLLIDTGAVILVAGGFFLAFRRSSVIGCMILMVTCGLLPVLHLVPTSFEPSLYHERYVMTSLAATCSMLALIQLPMLTATHIKLIRYASGIIGCLWLMLAVVGIRMTVPLWSNSVNLWQWVLIENPNSSDAKNNLLIAYVESQDNTNANRLIAKLLAEKTSCANCLLNAAIFAVSENNPALASEALSDVRDNPEITADAQMFQSYLLTTGRMLVLQNKLSDAEAIFRTAAAQNPMAIKPQQELARTLVMEGKRDDASQSIAAYVSLLPLGDQEAARTSLMQVFNQKGEQQ